MKSFFEKFDSKSDSKSDDKITLKYNVVYGMHQSMLNIKHNKMCNSISMNFNSFYGLINYSDLIINWIKVDLCKEK